MLVYCLQVSAFVEMSVGIVLYPIRRNGLCLCALIEQMRCDLGDIWPVVRHADGAMAGSAAILFVDQRSHLMMKCEIVAWKSRQHRPVGPDTALNAVPCRPGLIGPVAFKKCG